jgi:hypothetical protein
VADEAVLNKVPKKNHQHIAIFHSTYSMCFLSLTLCEYDAKSYFWIKKGSIVAQSSRQESILIKSVNK